MGRSQGGRKASRELDRNAPRPGLTPLSLLALPRGVFCEQWAKRHGRCIGPKITPGGFAGNVVSASPTRSHPAVLFLLPVSLATLQSAWAGEPGCCLLPAGPAATSGEAISEANRAGEEQKVGADVNEGPGFVCAVISSLSVFSMLDIILIVSHQLWHSTLDTVTDYALFGWLAKIWREAEQCTLIFRSIRQFARRLSQFYKMMCFQKSSIWRRIRQQHHAPLCLGRFHTCYVKFIFHNDISKVAYLVCWLIHLHVDKFHFTVTDGTLLLCVLLCLIALVTQVTKTCHYLHIWYRSLTTHLPKLRVPFHVPALGPQQWPQGVIPHCNQEANTEVVSELSRNPPNSQLSPAPFASEDSRICPVLEAWFCLLAKDHLRALQLTQ